VVKEIDVEHIMHIITGNGLNYKKACRMVTRIRFVWQPRVAGTINLMLKSIIEHVKKGQR
jgi:hypothetical protein